METLFGSSVLQVSRVSVVMCIRMSSNGESSSVILCSLLWWFTFALSLHMTKSTIIQDNTMITAPREAPIIMYVFSEEDPISVVFLRVVLLFKTVFDVVISTSIGGMAILVVPGFGVSSL